MEKYLSVLRECPLFVGITDGDILRMLVCFGAKVEHFEKKQTIISEGTRAKYIGIVLSGSVQVVQIDYYGNRSIIGNASRSQVFAEAFACAGVDNIPVDVIVGEDCEIMMIDSSHVMHTCGNHCGFHQRLIFNIMRDLAKKSIVFHKRMEITAKRTTREKLLTYLALEAKDRGTSSFDIPFDRQELADYLEVDRSGLSSEIGKLRKAGILDSRKRHFKLLNVEER